MEGVPKFGGISLQDNGIHQNIIKAQSRTFYCNAHDTIQIFSFHSILILLLNVILHGTALSQVAVLTH
jgi:hypothetical protein